MRQRARVQTYFIRLFILAQIGFIVLIIYRENRFIAHLYELQKAEQEYAALSDQHKKLLQQLHKTQSMQEARLYAQRNPSLKPLKMSSVRTI